VGAARVGHFDESDTPSAGRQNLISKLLAIKVDFGQVISNQNQFLKKFLKLMKCFIVSMKEMNENVYCSIIE
jgi:hypothetical protein